MHHSARERTSTPARVAAALQRLMEFRINTNWNALHLFPCQVWNDCCLQLIGFAFIFLFEEMSGECLHVVVFFILYSYLFFCVLNNRLIVQRNNCDAGWQIWHWKQHADFGAYSWSQHNLWPAIHSFLLYNFHNLYNFFFLSKVHCETHCLSWCHLNWRETCVLLGFASSRAATHYHFCCWIIG